MQANTLGEILKERRKAKGWTAVRLSRESGVSMTHIGRIEKGQRFPSATILRQLAGPLGFTEVELFQIAGFLPRGAKDERLERVKGEVKEALAQLWQKIDSL